MSSAPVTLVGGTVSMPVNLSAVNPLLDAYPADLRERAIVAIDHVRSRVLDMIVYIAPDTAWANIERDDIFTIAYSVFSDGFFVLDIDLHRSPPAGTQGTFVVLRGGIPTPIIVNSWNDGPSATLVAGSGNSSLFSVDASAITSGLRTLVAEAAGGYLQDHAAITASAGVAALDIFDVGAVNTMNAVPAASGAGAISIRNQPGGVGVHVIRPAGQHIQAVKSRAVPQAIAAVNALECLQASGTVSPVTR